MEIVVSIPCLAITVDTLCTYTLLFCIEHRSENVSMWCMRNHSTLSGDGCSQNGLEIQL